MRGSDNDVLSIYLCRIASLSAAHNGAMRRPVPGQINQYILEIQVGWITWNLAEFWTHDRASLPTSLPRPTSFQGYPAKLELFEAWNNFKVQAELHTFNDPSFNMACKHLINA